MGCSPLWVFSSPCIFLQNVLSCHIWCMFDLMQGTLPLSSHVDSHKTCTPPCLVLCWHFCCVAPLVWALVIVSCAMHLVSCSGACCMCALVSQSLCSASTRPQSPSPVCPCLLFWRHVWEGLQGYAVLPWPRARVCHFLWIGGVCCGWHPLSWERHSRKPAFRYVPKLCCWFAILLLHFIEFCTSTVWVDAGFEMMIQFGDSYSLTP